MNTKGANILSQRFGLLLKIILGMNSPVNSTIIVAITLESLHVFEKEFSYCLILASTLTCIIPPSIFRSIKKENFHEQIETVLE